MSTTTVYHIWVPEDAEIEGLRTLNRLGIEYNWVDQYEEED